MHSPGTCVTRHARQLHSRIVLAIQYLALTTMMVLYSLMFIGGYVSAAGLGLTCPEWPLCPDGIMPSEEYLIEWIHRLVAATTGALVIATMVASLINKNSDRKIKITSSLATVFVVTQITLGALVIDLKTAVFHGVVDNSVCFQSDKNPSAS